ncbi:MAG: hypothetical protein ACD_80C00142G0014 [uncultured bacterium (gcode 4)]|uniref:Uncharacterized protein n=1 Tax=uncultured bacterium (gcode 4) TaxID=1234023 RepID=K1XIH5_9BACT|nr:MAG: hypothetical protein ACD_80C00142G0014 [uncultured bacterium (gcode 4)]
MILFVFLYDYDKKRFYNALLKAFEGNMISSLEDVVNIYKWINNKDNYRESLNEYLREFLIAIFLSKNISDENIKSKIKEKISDFIKQNEKISPFSELPMHERNILDDLEFYIWNTDKKWIERKVDELKNVILVRYTEHKKLEKVNKRAVPLAIIWLVLTLIFWLISLFVKPWDSINKENSWLGTGSTSSIDISK